MSGSTLTIRAKLAFSTFALDVDETLKLNGITALFGPSGSGKSTLLRVISGLDSPETGQVNFDGANWLDTSSKTALPAHNRPVGMVFQDARLFTHLSVSGNLQFAAKRAPSGQSKITLDEVVSSLGLDPLLARKPATLSGGEKQRVAIGRTLLTQPELMLLDEPLSALDVRRKGELLAFIEKVLRQFEVPALYVSHAIDEVVQIADSAIIMADGRILGQGAVPAIFQERAMHGFTGNFEAGAVIEVRIKHQDDDFRLTCLDFEGEEIFMPMISGLTIGNDIRLRVRSRDVTIARGRPSGLSTRNCVAATIVGVYPEEETAFAEVDLQVGQQLIRARITRQAASDLALTTGDNVFALIKGISFDRRTLISQTNR
ncbi:MAG: molybdenum ABC transporter ATP-binding protein [Hyphomicrobiales bacterium]